ncbi:glycosyltransferase family 4 protein [Pseudoalteromonas sp. NSLLW24]|uniref:glycosyltransferase family 4 protein n=1 Tax=unclassified Pseudoalteromonas TaxID=194690 RepID=UPI0018CCAF92|nr:MULTISPECIES: glycosyltransferase family 4 protein [unclassified Pseudoalteromonas]MBG9999191.1 glycosyltransferase family 4 protein [Pseudoalteromonas sp. NSLLW24]MBH0078157.1 glycosyltransferase family 4 protein [Pseudoalteromonas sp. NZS11]
MLFIYGALPVGGIETFFMRMAKERHRLGLHTTILLLSLPHESNPELLNEMKKYANVLFPDDIFLNLGKFTRRLPLLVPVKKRALERILENVDQIHASDGMHALVGYRLSNMLNKNIIVTVGFYHYIKFLWGGDNVAWHEKVNRKFIFDFLPEKSLLFFSEGNRQLYIKHKRKKLTDANTFRLGVIDKKDIKVSGEVNLPIKIVAIGRLVDFKTYNFYMIKVLKNLKTKGFNVQFDIYGDGPLKAQIADEINKAGLSESIHLKGTLDYLKFDETVSNYNLFIGSGTAIIQAAALGLPSIVGVENVIEAETYGYFSDVNQYEYNLKGLDLEMISVETIIEDYINMNTQQRKTLISSHLECIDSFTNESCQKSMDELKYITMPAKKLKYNRWIYEFSRILDRVSMRFNKRHPKLTQFEDFKPN